MRWTSLLTLLMILQAGCAHAPRPDSRVYIVSESAEAVGSSLARGGTGGNDCQKEHEQCVERCWNKKNWPYPHNKEQSGWYLERCEHDCSQEFKKCEEEQEEVERAREKKMDFARMDTAIAWLRAHKTEVALGTIVVVAGVAFVLTTGGSGALILAPLTL